MLTDAYPTILIPAYQPNDNLVALIKSLRDRQPQQRIIVVDDGSDVDKQVIFSKIQTFNIELLRHTKNKGKGQALKTGFQHCDSERTSAPGRIFAPTRCSNCSARRCRSRQRTFFRALEDSKRRPMFSATDRSGKSAGCW